MEFWWAVGASLVAGLLLLAFPPVRRLLLPPAPQLQVEMSPKVQNCFHDSGEGVEMNAWVANSADVAAPLGTPVATRLVVDRQSVAARVIKWVRADHRGGWQIPPRGRAAFGILVMPDTPMPVQGKMVVLDVSVPQLWKGRWFQKRREAVLLRAESDSLRPNPP